MEYNAEKKAFLCKDCGPGLNKWKYIFNSVRVNEETGEVFCLCHKDTLLGHVNQVPEWRDDGK
jgi:hypothetical protein